jgi:hypothetical protein
MVGAKSRAGKVEKGRVVEPLGGRRDGVADPDIDLYSQSS